VADPKILKRGKTICQPRPHLSHASYEIYAFYTEEAAFRKKNMSQWGGAAPTAPPESATDVINYCA